MNLLLILTEFALLFGLNVARKPLDSWTDPPPSLKKKIDLTTKEYAFWTGLGKYLPYGENVQPGDSERFCKCSTNKKRSLVDIVKRRPKKKQTGTRRERREWRKMTNKMKAQFHKHFQNLAVKQPGEEKSKLQLLADWHRQSESPAAHRGAGFLVWHREFLFRLVMKLFLDEINCVHNSKS